MSILGITVEETTLDQVLMILGSAEVRSIGQSGSGADAMCYEGPDGTALTVVTNTAMSGDAVALYELLSNVTLARYFDPGGAVVPEKARPTCSPLKRLTRTTRTGGGLSLGMTARQARRILGSPSIAEDQRLVFRSRKRIAATPDAGAIEIDGPFHRVRTVEIRFDQGRAVAIRAIETTSN